MDRAVVAALVYAYSPSSVSNDDPAVDSASVPSDGAVYVYQMDAAALLPAMLTSPGSRDAPTVEPLTAAPGVRVMRLPVTVTGGDERTTFNNHTRREIHQGVTGDTDAAVSCSYTSGAHQSAAEEGNERIGDDVATTVRDINATI